jgi:hypothetical protein
MHERQGVEDGRIFGFLRPDHRRLPPAPNLRKILVVVPVRTRAAREGFEWQ